MKILYAVLIMFCLSGCSLNSTSNSEYVEKDKLSAEQYLLDQNKLYVNAKQNKADISLKVREDTAENGQNPYAVIITCSDSRVPPEHIFLAGIGELFVIRTAGNVLSDFEIGSVEYAVEHLETPLVVVLGHEQCGAVDAAISGHALGYIKTITDEISVALDGETNPRVAEKINVQNSVRALSKSSIIQQLYDDEKIEILGAMVSIESGKVELIDANFAE